MLAKEALDVLSLRPGATPVEIKEAYRDLVKVWHPDRLGSDPRLRQKAEDKLKQINDAYRVLQSDPGVGGRYGVGPERTASYSSSAPIPRSGRARASRDAVGVGWIYGCLGMALVFLAGYLVIEYGAMRTERPTPASVQQAVPETPAMQTPGGVLAGHDVHSAVSSGRSVQAKEFGRSNHASAAQFQVRSLSGAETVQLESACSRQKEVQGQAAYQACLKAQLDLITNALGQPDLSALSGAECESIESACSEAKRLRGSDGYNRCLTAQMARLAAEPALPDLSALNEADRDSIELACRNAKYREGPAAYDRCRVRFMKALVESR